MIRPIGQATDSNRQNGFARHELPDKTPKIPTCHDLETRCLQLLHEFVVIETIEPGMVKKTSPERVIDHGAKDLFAEEQPAWLEHAEHLADYLAPGVNMVNDAEIEHGVIDFSGHAECPGISDPQVDPVFVSRQSSFCLRRHSRIEVESIDRRRAEFPQRDFDSDAPPATQFERAPPIQTPAQAGQLLGLHVSLHRTAQRIVHQCVFESVQSHRLLPLPDPKKSLARRVFFATNSDFPCV